MSLLPESNTWITGIYQLEETDPVQGGPNGKSNQQAKELANRTAYLKAQIETLGTGKQPIDPTLSAIAALTGIADRLIYFTGPDTAALTPLSAFIRTLLDDADASSARATLGAISQAQLDAALASLVNSSPAALDTLNELAFALGNDPSFATTMTNALSLKASILSIQKAEAIVSPAGGTADAITASYTPAIATLSDGMTLYVRAASANTSTAPTFTPKSGSIPAKAIIKGASTVLDINDIAGAGHWLKLQYDSILDKWVLLNPATGITPGLTQAQADARYCGIGFMLVEHQLAQGTDAGNTSAGVNQRPLNTVVANTISGASLSSNQITLPAGTYRLRAVAEAWHCNGSKLALYNVTDAAYVAQGISINGENTLSDLMAWQISMNARFTLAGTKVLELRQYSEIATTAGFGKAANSMGVEVYASVEINKE